MWATFLCTCELNSVSINGVANFRFWVSNSIDPVCRTNARYLNENGSAFLAIFLGSADKNDSRSICTFGMMFTEIQDLTESSENPLSVWIGNKKRVMFSNGLIASGHFVRTFENGS